MTQLKKYMKKIGNLIILTLSALLPASILASTHEPRGRCGDLSFNSIRTVDTGDVEHERSLSNGEHYQELPLYMSNEPTRITSQQTATFRDPMVVEREEIEAWSRDW